MEDATQPLGYDAEVFPIHFHSILSTMIKRKINHFGPPKLEDSRDFHFYCYSVVDTQCSDGSFFFPKFHLEKA